MRVRFALAGLLRALALAVAPDNAPRVIPRVRAVGWPTLAERWTISVVEVKRQGHGFGYRVEGARNGHYMCLAAGWATSDELACEMLRSELEVLRDVTR